MFPSQQSTEESGRLEEERRLCYVGMTRAMEALHLLCGEPPHLRPRDVPQAEPLYPRDARRVSGRDPAAHQVSRPTQYVRPARNEVAAELRPAASSSQRVLHPEIREGIVPN